MKMNNDEKYFKVVGSLRSSRPVLRDKERLADNIMEEVYSSHDKLTFREKLVYYLFGWVDNYWLRGTMATAAILFTGIFIIQQVLLANRINNLERNLIRTVNTGNVYEPEQEINHKVLLDLVFEELEMEDSITVSRSDLLKLLKNYQELLDNYDNISRDYNKDREIQKIIRRSNDKSTGNDES
jgi:hypothetical protein